MRVVIDLVRGFGLLCAGALFAVPRPAEAFDVSGGVSVGGMMAGAVPHFAVTPHLALSWRFESGFSLGVQDLCSILPPRSKLGIGVSNELAASIGYAGEKVSFGLGPSLGIYSMPACGSEYCGRIVGLSPGGHAEAAYYVAGIFGIMIHAEGGWIGGRSLVVPDGFAAMVVAGPVLRWRSE